MAEKEMSFWDHLEVLRWSIIRVAVALLLVFIAAFVIMPGIFDSVILGPSSSEFFVYKWMSPIFSADFKERVAHSLLNGIAVWLNLPAVVTASVIPQR